MRITAEDYDRVGGVVGALKAEADRTLAKLERDGLGELVVPTLLELVHVETERDVAGRTVERSAFGEAGNRVLDAFVEARLLTSAEDEPTVSVAHEALLREWGLLARAIDGSRDRLVAARGSSAMRASGTTPVATPPTSSAAAGSRRRGRRSRPRSAPRARSSRRSSTSRSGRRGAGRGARSRWWRPGSSPRLSWSPATSASSASARTTPATRPVPRSWSSPGGGAVDEHEVTNAAYARCVAWGDCASPPVSLARRASCRPPARRP